MRGVLIGLVLAGVLTFSLLSLRPGGLRNQLRNIGRRFKLALLLGGAYMIVAALLRLLSPSELITDGGMVAAALVLGGIFLVRSQEKAEHVARPSARR